MTSHWTKVWLVAICAISLQNTAAADSTEDWIELGGDVLMVALPLTALTASYTLDDAEGRSQLLWSVGTTAVVTHATKRLVGKERPDGSDNLSFPSGHTSAAFSGAAFLAKRYGWDIGVPAYLAASFVGYSRVQADKHDWWDVAAGAGLAIGVNELLVSKQSDSDLSAFIAPTEGGVHLALSFRY